MARPLRIDVAGAWYHAMNRGHRAGALFLDETDRRRFLGAVAELPERFGLEVHAFVLMGNHYHLLVRTTEANLSHAMRWLNVSYAVKFNWAHRCHGTVFEGRFKGVLIQEERKAVEVARYLHLNPVRLGGLGLSKSDQRRARVLGCERPEAELVRRRLELLREYRWSSWRIYLGMEPNPGWLESGVIGRGCGGPSRVERRAALRAYTEGPIRQGVLEGPWEGVVGGVVLEDSDYARALLPGRKVNEEEQTPARRMRRRIRWEELVRAAEAIRGERWDRWSERHGDWGRDAVMYVAVHHGGMRLAEVVREVGMKYQAAAQAVKRFGEGLADDPNRKRLVSRLRHSLPFGNVWRPPNQPLPARSEQPLVNPSRRHHSDSSVGPVLANGTATFLFETGVSPQYVGGRGDCVLAFAGSHCLSVSSQVTTNTNPVADFGERLAASLSDETFVRLVLSPSSIAPDNPTRILGRAVTIRGQAHLSLTFRYPTRDEVKNLPVANAATWVTQQLGGEIKGGLLSTTQGDWQLSVAESGQARLIRHKPSATTTLPRTHDQPRRSTLDKSACDWLEGLGVTDAQGKVRPGMADKHAQVSRFLEIFSHLAHEIGWIDSKTLGPDPGWTMVDMGCGKGYLTFGLWHLWHRVWGLPGRVLGVELREELVKRTTALATAIHADELQFAQGSIDSTSLPEAQVLIALHACDTATDDAILRGIRMHTRLILVAPCCHKELRPQLGSPEPLAPVLGHGIMAARMADWVTDGLRALFLEWAGYRTKIFEFISSEHTAKNLMIAAVRDRAPFTDPAALQRARDLKAFFGIEHHALDPLLLRTTDS